MKKLITISIFMLGMIIPIAACGKNLEDFPNEKVQDEYSEKIEGSSNLARETEESTTEANEEQQIAEVGEDEILEQYREFFLNLAKLLEDEELEQVFGEMESDEFQELKEWILRNDNPLVYEKEGKGIGLYKTRGPCMVYYGDYRNGLRHGYGIWVQSWFEEDNWLLMTYKATGQWSEDFPNGAQEEVMETKSVDRSQVRTRIGTVIDGVWDGQIQECYKGNENIYRGSLTRGYWNVIEQGENGNYIILETLINENQNTGLKQSKIGCYEEGLQIQEGIWGFVE